MNRLCLILLMFTVLAIGCSKSEQSDSNTKASTDRSQLSQQPDTRDVQDANASDLDSVQDSLPTPPAHVNRPLQTPPAQDEPAAIREMVTDVADLMLKARQLEANLDFDAAVPVWEQINERVTRQYGNQSWQATNSRLAIESAKIRQQMNFDQRRILFELDEADRIGDRQMDSQDYIDALTNRATACDLARQLWASDSHLVAGYLFKQAQAHQAVGQFPEAESLMRQVLQSYEKAMGKVHPEYAGVQHALAILYQQNNQLELAQVPMQESVEICRQVWGDQSQAYATYLNDLGVLDHAAGRFAQSDQTLSLACQVYEASAGRQSFDYAHCRFNLANAKVGLQNLEQAQLLLEEALSIFLSMRSGDHEMVLQTRLKLATVLLMRENPVDAEIQLKIVSDVRRRVRGSLHPEYAKSMFQYGIALGKQGKYQLAEPVFREALEIQTAALGVGHDDALRTAETLAIVYRKTNNEQAALLLEDQIRIARQSGGPIR